MKQPAWLQALAKIRAGTIQNESALHRAVTAVLHSNDIKFEHEKELNAANRIDFMVEADALLYGIECKVRPGGMDVWRQLERYAAHCDFLVLITTKAVGQVIAPDPSAYRARRLWVLELWKNF
jgi:hypothetical protein